MMITIMLISVRQYVKNRSKVDIIYDILASAIDGGVKKDSYNVYSNLSSEQMKFYFHTLLSESLLTTDEDREDNFYL